jgi:hypothetical protein
VFPRRRCSGSADPIRRCYYANSISLCGSLQNRTRIRVPKYVRFTLVCRTVPTRLSVSRSHSNHHLLALALHNTSLLALYKHNSISLGLGDWSGWCTYVYHIAGHHSTPSVILRFAVGFGIRKGLLMRHSSILNRYYSTLMKY